MKITIVCGTKTAFDILSPRSQGLGGIETACIELSRGLAARGHVVTLVTRTDKRVSEGGVVNVGPDAVDGRGADVCIAASDARLLEKLRGRRHVFWVNNPLTLEKAFRRGQFLPMMRLRPHAVFDGDYAERSLSRLYPFASRSVIPYGVSAEFLSLQTGGKRALNFVWVSQVHRGLANTLGAWREALPRLPEEAAFHVFGIDPATWMMGEGETRNLRIVLHPRITKPALAAFYEGAIAMVYPGAHDEMFCLAAAEAMCAGLPVITMGIGALSERVQHGYNGLICRHQRQVAEAIVTLSRDAEFTAMLRQGALQYRPLAGWDRPAKMWESLFDRLP